MSGQTPSGASTTDAKRRAGLVSAANPNNRPIHTWRRPVRGEYPCHFCDRVLATKAARGSHERTHLGGD